MKSIIKLLLADLRHKKRSFIIIAALMAMITLSFSGTVSNNDNLEKALNDSFENYEVGDLLVTLGDAEYSPELIENVKSDPDVEKIITDELIKANGIIELNGSRFEGNFYFAEFNDKVRVMNDDISETIRGITPKTGEVYISYSLSQLSDIEKGAKLVVGTSTGDEVFTVAGFVEDPIYGSSFSGDKNFFISPDDFSRIKNEKTDPADQDIRFLDHYYFMKIFKSSDIADEKLAAELNEKCGIIDDSFAYTTKTAITDFIFVVSGFGTKILLVFVILLTIAVMVTISNDISSTVEMDHANLGILKSQGFTTWQIRTVYILRYAAALILGSAVGIAASIPLIKYLGGLFVNITDILTNGDTSALKCIALAAGLCVICSAASIISTAKIARISPINAIRGGQSDDRSSDSLNVGIRQTPLTFFVALRQLTSKPGSYIGTGIITAVLVFFMISAGLIVKDLSYEVIGGSIESPPVNIILFDRFEEDDISQLETDIRELNESAVLMTYGSLDNIYIDDIMCSVTSSSYTDELCRPYDGICPESDNEVVITGTLANALNKKVGDTMTIHSKNASYDYIITGIYQNLGDTGGYASITTEGGRHIDILPDSAFVTFDENNDADIKATIDMLNEKYSGRIYCYESASNNTLEGVVSLIDTLLDTIIIVIYSVSCVFGILVVAMLSSRALLREQHDIGIYKSLGFSVGKLRAQFTCRFVTIAILSSALGIALALAFSQPLFAMILRSVGMTNFIGSFSLALLLVPSSAICVCFGVFTYFASHRIKNVNVRQLITE